MAEEEEDPSQAMAHSDSEGESSPAFSFPSSLEDVDPLPLEDSAFSFSSDQENVCSKSGVLDPGEYETATSGEVAEDGESCSSVHESVQDEGKSVHSPKSYETASSIGEITEAELDQAVQDHVSDAKSNDSHEGDRSKEVIERAEQHCDVVDVIRRGVQNWRVVTRMSGSWLGCRCCYKSANCCQHSRKDSQDTDGGVACCSRKSSVSPMKSRKDAQDPQPVTSPRKSTISPLRSSKVQIHSEGSSLGSGYHARRESDVTEGRKSGVTSLRSFKLTSTDELLVHVPPGMIGLAWLGSEPLLLTSKSYTYPLNSAFSLQELALESTRVINHGNLHRVLIPDGKLGVAWVDGHAKVLEPGVHVLSCSSFAYTTSDDRDSSQKEVALGPFRVVTVKEDEVGVKYCNRKPHLLYAGRHLIDISKVEVFAGFESLRIRNTTASDLVACSRDEIMAEAQVSFRWQIAPQDIATARGASVADIENAIAPWNIATARGPSVADIENAVVAKLRRAFAIVFWCLKGDEIMIPYSVVKDDVLLLSGPMKAFATEISKRCLEAVVDLFDEGWTVTFWGMWFESLKLRRYSRVRPVKGVQEVQPETKPPITRKKKVQIVTEN